MQLPAETAAASQRVRFGRFVARRARKAKLTTMAQDITESNNAVKQAARTQEDAAEPIQDALADRESADVDLDTATQEARLQLASRSLSATQEAPYNKIFPSGIEHYTAAPLDKEEERYQELLDRLAANLPENDPVRQEATPKIKQGLEDFKKAKEELSKARSAYAQATSNLESTEEAWGTLMERTYGLLVAQVGKRSAERFFPRRSAARIDEADAPTSGS